MTHILGISAFYHDSAACIIKDDEIISASQEERFTRIKHDPHFPKSAIKSCLNSSNLKISDIEYIVFYEKPLLKFERLLETYLSIVPKGFKSFKKAIPIWSKEKLFQKKIIINELNEIEKNNNVANKIFFSEHHLSHAASAFFPSNLEESVILTMDGVGEWATTTVGIGKGNTLNLHKEINFPNSLGLLFSAFTYYLGFKVNDGEYKVMGLAPYGKPIFKKKILDNLIDVKDDGSFRLNQEYFDYCGGLKMTNKKFDKLFFNNQRTESQIIKNIHMDIAASIQSVLEEITLKITKNLYKTYKLDNLCMAGGVALNCVANGKILEKSGFKNIWIQPAAGDAGGALGAALSFYYIHLNKKRIIKKKDSMKNCYLGPTFTNNEIKSYLNNNKIKYKFLNDDSLCREVSKLISQGNVIGWMQGKMEFGPRALGNRSILADPRNPNMQKVLNLKIKFRESFRPFAPIILYEDLTNWFNLKCESPYMLLVSLLKKNKLRDLTINEKKIEGFHRLDINNSKVPSITHVDNSARVQTLKKDSNELLYNLLSQFKQKTKCPILINTSFNIKDEPIVCSPEESYKCFLKTEIDILVMGNYLCKKKKS